MHNQVVFSLFCGDFEIYLNQSKIELSWLIFCHRGYLEQLKAVALITMRVCVSEYVTGRLVASEGGGGSPLVASGRGSPLVASRGRIPSGGEGKGAPGLKINQPNITHIAQLVLFRRNRESVRSMTMFLCICLCPCFTYFQETFFVARNWFQFMNMANRFTAFKSLPIWYLKSIKSSNSIQAIACSLVLTISNDNLATKSLDGCSFAFLLRYRTFFSPFFSWALNILNAFHCWWGGDQDCLLSYALYMQAPSDGPATHKLLPNRPSPPSDSAPTPSDAYLHLSTLKVGGMCVHSKQSPL